MIAWVLRALGARDERPEVATVRFPATAAEAHYERVRRTTEQTIRRADRETERGRLRLVSWEDLYDPRRRP
jgi:hypothetical protein